MDQHEPGRALVPVMTETAMQAMVDRAAEEGAKRALAHIGLHDEDAAQDVRELRHLLEAWRDAKRTALQTIVRSVTTLILGIVAAGVIVKLWKP